MSIFDPATFMDQGTTEAGSTQAPICEPGEYPGVVDKVEPKVITSKKDGRDFIILEVTWKLQNADFEKSFGRQPTVRQSLFLDMNGNNLDMSKGKNVPLNKLRDALGMNKAGQQFKFSMLQGAGPAKVMVKNNPDRNAPDVMRAEVVAVGKM